MRNMVNRSAAAFPRPRLIAAGVVLLVALVHSTALSQGAPKDPPDVQHQVSITISPVHLAVAIVEAMVEYRVDDKVGMAGILGGGQITVKADDGEEMSFTVFEAGAQARYYVLGNFIHGMQVGVEVLYAYVSTKDEDLDVSAVGKGLAVGPFVGYKIATNSGFTFDAQLGAQYMVVKASAEADSTGETASASDSDVLTLLNLNIGWSF
jgi:hypothetical protein